MDPAGGGISSGYHIRKAPAVADRGHLSPPRLPTLRCRPRPPGEKWPASCRGFHGTRHSPTNPRPAPCISSPAGKGCSLSGMQESRRAPSHRTAAAADQPPLMIAHVVTILAAFIGAVAVTISTPL
jgi:hypothetical protein